MEENCFWGVLPNNAALPSKNCMCRELRRGGQADCGQFVSLQAGKDMVQFT